MEDVREKMWMKKYAELKEYIIAHKHLPDKHKVENRGLLNWWKYNMKRKNKGLLVEERIAMLEELSNMRSKEHTGGWTKGKPRKKREEASENE